MQNVPKITSYQKGSCDDKVFEKSVCEKVTNNKTLRELFVKYSNAVPSSATVKGLFSLGKEELKPKQSWLSDDHFEEVVFLK